MPESVLENQGMGAAMQGNNDLQAACRPEAVCHPECEDRRRKGDLLRNHEITINFLNVGCVVRVGCKSIAFNNISEALSEINMYITDPYTAIEKWNKIFNANE